MARLMIHANVVPVEAEVGPGEGPGEAETGPGEPPMMKNRSQKSSQFSLPRSPPGKNKKMPPKKGPPKGVPFNG